MCGRYTFTPDEKFYDRFDINEDGKLDNLESRYNVAPGQDMPVITRNSPNKAVLMKWGLIPFWAKDPKIAYRTINAKAETINKKPTFRKPFTSQRCLIPANGFYEWKKTEVGKIPYYFYLKTKEAFAFAGLYDIWKNEKGEEVKTYTIITTNSNNFVKKVHFRMPVLLEKEDESKWLNKSTSQKDLLSLLVPFPDDLLEAYPVASQVNNARIDEPDLIKPANPNWKL
jgi:putative SOS response-associated peptidase YedK